MASGGALRELCEEATCSICLDYFADPVTISECGHNFCRACLSRSWGEGAAKGPCPHCRGSADAKSLRPNLQLANVVEITKKLSLQEGKGGVCEKHQGPPPGLFCVVCSRSQEHRDLQVAPLEEAALEEKAAVGARKRRVCQKHQEPLKLFCKDDEALICVVCDRSKEHRYHQTLPLQEASQEYKGQFCNCLEILKKEREKIVAYKGDVEKESQDLLKQTEKEKQVTVAKFKQLHKFLEEKEDILLARMEWVEKEVGRRRDQHLSRLSEELSSLESLIQEIEEKSQQPASDLLQGVRSTLQRYKEKKSFKNPVVFPLTLKWHIWDFSDLNVLLEGIKKQIRDNLDSGLYQQKASVTLDPDTAHPQLILSEDQKSVRQGCKTQTLRNNPERFNHYGIVLGHEGLTGGRHFWEVLVGHEDAWVVGVARKSVRRKGELTFCPAEGIWQVGKWDGSYIATEEDHNPLLTVNGELNRIRVCLNYPGGRVAFFDADQGTLLYEYTGASFSGETLLPFFWVRLKGHLKISS